MGGGGADGNCRGGGTQKTELLLFPYDFAWGTATSAYQVEGGWKEGNKGLSIWDYFSHTQGKVKHGDNGDITDDHYHLYKDDVKHMAKMGLKHYRLSIAWSRIQPNGVGPANPAGVTFYNDLIDEIVANGLEPMVTLYHWDLPLALQVEQSGWLGGTAVSDAFAEYARLCFANFGDRVKRWVTINEPWCVCVLGFCSGEHAPGRTRDPWREPYVAAHCLLVAHGKAAKVYHDEFKASQGGEVGITLNCDWRVPKPSKDDNKYRRNCAAAERALEFFLGWFADPIYHGDYPLSMRRKLGSRLPAFTEEEKSIIKGSSDFFALNHYSTWYTEDATASQLTPVPASSTDSDADWIIVTDGSSDDSAKDSGKESLNKSQSTSSWGLGSIMSWVHGGNVAEDQLEKKSSVHPFVGPGWYSDSGCLFSSDSSWPKTDMGWGIVPWGLRCLLKWVQDRYSPPGGIVVTENGCALHEPTVESAKADIKRVNFLKGYISAVHQAIYEDKVDCRGYFCWSFMDNFEWAYGFSKRFGLHWVNYETLERTPKESFYWYARVIARNGLYIKD